MIVDRVSKIEFRTITGYRSHIISPVNAPIWTIPGCDIISCDFPNLSILAEDSCTANDMQELEISFVYHPESDTYGSNDNGFFANLMRKRQGTNTAFNDHFRINPTVKEIQEIVVMIYDNASTPAPFFTGFLKYAGKSYNESSIITFSVLDFLCVTKYMLDSEVSNWDNDSSIQDNLEALFDTIYEDFKDKTYTGTRLPITYSFDTTIKPLLDFGDSPGSHFFISTDQEIDRYRDDPKDVFYYGYYKQSASILKFFLVWSRSSNPIASEFKTLIMEIDIYINYGFIEKQTDYLKTGSAHTLSEINGFLSSDFIPGLSTDDFTVNHSIVDNGATYLQSGLFYGIPSAWTTPLTLWLDNYGNYTLNCLKLKNHVTNENAIKLSLYLQNWKMILEHNNIRFSNASETVDEDDIIELELSQIKNYELLTVDFYDLPDNSICDVLDLSADAITTIKNAQDSYYGQYTENVTNEFTLDIMPFTGQVITIGIVVTTPQIDPDNEYSTIRAKIYEVEQDEDDPSWYNCKLYNIV